ncbi:unnamed protein product [Protopolystoma xenopodis]|uniref:Uncharacterized protein n=1 Tax=Protopolystoma xenopodis TaxID=117903 RepID=A0A448WXE2_9PLAT|nr:unnamed protein product [Protopolystoma xenopodis]
MRTTPSWLTSALVSNCECTKKSWSHFMVKLWLRTQLRVETANDSLSVVGLKAVSIAKPVHGHEDVTFISF